MSLTILNLRGSYNMADNLIITRLWQDIEFFQIEIECKTELIAVRGKVYTTDDLIDDLCNKIEAFLSGHMDATCWQNGTRGDTTTPCTALRFSRKDELGHVLIEVFMEIDDGGALSTHNCCFYINTEVGLLYQFKENLPKLKAPQLGIRVSLTRAEDSN